MGARLRPVSGSVGVFLLVLLVLLPAGPAERKALAASLRSESPQARIVFHRITVRLDPGRHFLEAVDQATFESEPGAGGKIAFVLAPGLRVTGISSAGQPVPWEVSRKPAVQRITLTAPRPGETRVVVNVSYRGPIYDPVRKPGDLGYLRGDETRGLISPEGIYLSPDSGWYPDQPGSLARYDLVAEVPVPFRVISQGELDQETEAAGMRRSRWKGEVPAEGLYLVAGNYVVTSRKFEGIELATYFFRDEAPLAPLFLHAAGRIIGFYTKLLGRYPYTRFAIVENFFSSGYGMPGFTLLGPQVIRMGKQALRPGYLDHEIVHSWWGNYVYPDPAGGNWAEGLTTYLTNYLAREVRGGKNEAAAYRKRIVEKFSTRVSPLKEYAPASFTEKRSGADDDIGYGKTAMIFYLLRQKLGETLFYRSLKTILQTYGGKRASWVDFESVFSRVGRRNLKRFFRQWVFRAASPVLSLQSVEVKAAAGRLRVSGTIRQEKPYFRLQVPVVIDFGPEKATLTVALRGGRARFSTLVDAPPHRIRIDPEFEIFRRLSVREIAPSLQAFLASPGRVIVLPGAASAGETAIYRDLARRVVEEKGARIVEDSELSGALRGEDSLFFLGNPLQNRALRDLLARSPVPLEWGPGKIEVRGETFASADTNLLACWRNPENPERFIVLYSGGSEEALRRWPYLFFYGWDGYVVFSGGRPVRRGDLVDTPTRGDFTFSSR